VNALVLDTNVLIRFLERGQDYSAHFSRFDRLLIPAIVNGEYRAGADPETNPGQRRIATIDALMSSPSVEFVPIGKQVSARYAAVFRQLRKQGTPIPQNDIWIAATALECNATLCSADDHYKHVTGLKLQTL